MLLLINWYFVFSKINEVEERINVMFITFSCNKLVNIYPLRFEIPTDNRKSLPGKEGTDCTSRKQSDNVDVAICNNLKKLKRKQIS